MRLLLCSDFKFVGEKYIQRFFKKNQKIFCLFVNYANEDDSPIEESFSYNTFMSLPYDIEYETLTPTTKLKKNPDLVYVRGGNTAKLLYDLKRFNQFEMIKNIVESGAVYLGISAGAILASSNILWTVRSEPFEKDLIKEFGGTGYDGYGWIDGLLFPHASRYRMVWEREKQNPDDEDYRVLNKEYYGDYLIDKRLFKNEKTLKIGNNEALFVDGKTKRLLRFDWSKFEIKK